MTHQVVYHTGSLPGLSTLVSFLPSDEIGVTIFANGDSKADPVMLILNRILDSALHLTSSLTPTRLAAFFFEFWAQLTHGSVLPLATKRQRIPMLRTRHYIWMPFLGLMPILVTDPLRYVARLAHLRIVPRFNLISPSSIVCKATQARSGIYSQNGLGCGLRTSVCGTSRVPPFRSTSHPFTQMDMARTRRRLKRRGLAHQTGWRNSSSKMARWLGLG